MVAERARFYVGHKSGKRSVFRSTEAPTEESHGESYALCTGPFRTKLGAIVLAEYGHAQNPHVLTVQDAERIARALPAAEKEALRRKHHETVEQ